MSQIQASTLDFLSQLSQNNTREWFNVNKSTYEEAHMNVISFADALLEEMHTHDKIETPTGKKSLHRIYRDIRFSKDKTPYKNHFGGGFKRATKYLRGGYYYHIEPGNTFVAGGFWGPNKDDLKLLRDQIAMDDAPLREVITSKAFQTTFGELLGQQLKTAPKGYDKEHEAIDLLRYKSFIIKKHFSDKEVLSSNFHVQMAESFKAMRPFFDCMTDMLITDLNGELLPGY